MSSDRPRSVPRRAIGMKIAADDRKAIPADANATYDPSATTQVLDAKRSATTVGMHDWKTIAPVMLPIASVGLPWLIQITELSFSGSSVAIGAMTSASRTLSISNWRARWSMAPTKNQAPRTIRLSATATWTLTIRRRGTAGRIL